MRYTFILLFLLGYLNSFGQANFAISLDTVSKTNVFNDSTLSFTQSGVISPYEIFIIEDNLDEKLRISGFLGQTGFISSKNIILLDSLDSDKYLKLLIRSIQIYGSYPFKQNSSKPDVNNNKINGLDKQINEFIKSELAPLIPYLTKMICTAPDKKAIIYLFEGNYCDKYYDSDLFCKPLIDVYLCQPDLIIDFIDSYGWPRWGNDTEIMLNCLNSYTPDNKSEKIYKKYKKRFINHSKEMQDKKNEPIMIPPGMVPND